MFSSIHNGVFLKCFRWIQWPKKKETEIIPLGHRDRGNRADPYTEPNSSFSDFSDFTGFIEFSEGSAPFRENLNDVHQNMIVNLK